MRYLILGGNGVFGVHTAKHLLVNHEVKCVGRNPEKPDHFTLGLKEYPNYSYEHIHVVNETWRLVNLIEDWSPNVIVNFAAQGEGALSWSHFEWFYQTNTIFISRITEELINRNFGGRWVQIGTSELYGSCPRARS